MLAFYRQRETKTEITLHKFEYALAARKSNTAMAFLLAITFVAAGCAGNEAALGDPALGMKCVDDSHVCISQRKMVFDSYMADTSRAWVNHPAGPHEYASGVRLMAFSKKRKELNCNELARGKAEADRGPSALSGGGYLGLTTAQIARGAMLAREVSRELAQEIARRCR
ncbi:hypothetical protein [Hyphomicrobium sp. 2TAF46]|uniref:hypothetical protein n=1 Tax=Hyphomicrobium sp. 2TAF46 TaxID=3233019 RepID=UPI003F92F96F